MQFIFAAAESTAQAAESQGLFGALGLNLQLFISQCVAFLILVAILRKFVYPALIKAIEDRRASIEAGLKEAKQSQEVLEQAEAKVAGMLADARKEADDILARTNQEAATVVTDAEAKAKTRAEQIVADARQQLAVDVTKARQALKKDTIELVALATERVINEKLDAQKDSKLVEQALTEKQA
ncbi:MAG TPA: F0F1 ATP synthase subunit B [Candidatus Saccharimonadales bacterium]|nr:F0F1 ATP synthase subunit B [Candidatus Saccharimonadales bacterium]